LEIVLLAEPLRNVRVARPVGPHLLFQELQYDERAGISGAAVGLGLVCQRELTTASQGCQERPDVL